MHYSTFLLILLVITVLFSCRKDKGTPKEWNGYPYEVGKILITKCATSGCHDSKSYAAAGNLDLSSWEGLFRGTAAGMPVIPYNSRFSYLMYFINSYPELGPMQEPKMPLNALPLSSEEVKTIKDWIDRGAPDATGNVFGIDISDKLFVVNQGCDAVYVINASDGKPIRCLEVGTQQNTIESPHFVKLSPDKKFFYVIFLNHNVVQKFRADDYSWVANIPLSPLAAGWNALDMKDWNTFEVSSDGKRGYAVAWTQNGAVAAVDLENHRLIHFYPSLTEPHGICLNPSEDTIIVTAQKGNYITLLDTSFQYKYEISVQPGFPPADNNQINIHEAYRNPINPLEIWLTCQASDDVRIFNLQTHTLQIIPVGDYPQTLDWSINQGKAYVSSPYDMQTFNGSEGSLAIIDATTKSIQKISFVPQGHGIYISDSKKRIYSASRNLSGSTYPPHHTTYCSGKNGYLTWFDLVTLQPSGKKTELSVDPYFIDGTK